MQKQIPVLAVTGLALFAAILAIVSAFLAGTHWYLLPVGATALRVFEAGANALFSAIRKA